MERFSITIGDKTYRVEIEDVTSSPVTVYVDGKAYNVHWEREKQEAAPAPKPAPAPANANAQTPALTKAAPQRAAVAPAGGELVEITAPMPGKILKVNVAPGDQVAHGQQVCSLEAMKMESAIQSTAAGTVVSVNVTPGQNVKYGDVLLVIQKQGA